MLTDMWLTTILAWFGLVMAFAIVIQGIVWFLFERRQSQKAVWTNEDRQMSQAWLWSQWHTDITDKWVEWHRPSTSMMYRLGLREARDRKLRVTARRP